MEVFIANFGRGNALWDDCRSQPTIASFFAQDAHLLWRARDKEAFIDLCVSAKTTAAGRSPTRSVASRWYNVGDLIAKTEGDMWIHRAGDDLWWTTSQPGEMTETLESVPMPGLGSEQVYVLRKPAAPWQNTDEQGRALTWDGLHAKARDFLSTESTRLRSLLEEGHSVTLIYDECHQLGAEKLGRNWRRFHDAVVKPDRKRARSFRTIGLSATPVPTNEASHRLLERCIFPRRSDGPSTHHGWPFHVFHRMPNAALVASGVLCPLNARWDESGHYDIPRELLEEVTGAAALPPPGPEADPNSVQRYSLNFNTQVMSDPRILDFIANRLGSRLDVLGKTIVFVPTIEAANRLAARIYRDFPEHRGRVAAVHSKMSEVNVEGQTDLTVHEVLQRFRELGSEPSLLVNVNMLTEGFDDPKIQTVVLARLTLSTNLFWQMIGRGTRGPACDGTNECNFIDPVKLVRLYEYFAGYQPSITSNLQVDFERSESSDVGVDLLSPEVPVAQRPPDPGACTYEVDPELTEIHRQVAMALEDFLSPISESLAVQAALHARVDLSEGRPLVKRSEGDFQEDTATAVLLGQISGLEKRTSHDLLWFRRMLPVSIDDPTLRHQLRWLRAIESLSLWTYGDFARAQMTGAFQSTISQEANLPESAAPVERQPDATATRDSAPAGSALTPAERSTLIAALALAQIAGKGEGTSLTYAQRLIIMDTLRRVFGRSPTEESERALNSEAKKPQQAPFEDLRSHLQREQRQALLTQLGHLAAVDNVISESEAQMLRQFANELEIPLNVARSILGEDVLPEDEQAAESGILCSNCSEKAPDGSCFCPACGTSLSRVAG